MNTKNLTTIFQSQQVIDIFVQKCSSVSIILPLVYVTRKMLVLLTNIPCALAGNNNTNRGDSTIALVNNENYCRCASPKLRNNNVFCLVMEYVPRMLLEIKQTKISYL